MLAFVLFSCVTENDTAGATVDCAAAPEVTWDGFAHGFVTTYCVSCHSVNNTDRRYGAPEGLDFDTEAGLYESGTRVRERTLVEQSMPPGGGVFADDLQLLDVYLTCQLGI